MEFSVRVPEVAELVAGDPEHVALENARRKAKAAGEDAGAAAVLGVDTVVCVGRQMYDKPADPVQASATLRALSGRIHTVISGVCLVETDRAVVAAASTSVEFRELDGDLLDWYVASGEWRGRAGGYAIQGRGAALVKRIDGDYLNVVGLPVATLLELAPWLLRTGVV